MNGICSSSMLQLTMLLGKKSSGFFLPGILLCVISAIAAILAQCIGLGFFFSSECLATFDTINHIHKIKAVTGLYEANEIEFLELQLTNTKSSLRVFSSLSVVSRTFPLNLTMWTNWFIVLNSRWASSFTSRITGSGKQHWSKEGNGKSLLQGNFAVISCLQNTLWAYEEADASLIQS